MGSILLKKPYPNHDSELIFIIENVGNKKSYESRGIITLYPGTIYLFSEGVFKLKRQHSSHKYNFVTAPFIYSDNLYGIDDEVYFMCASDQGLVYDIDEDVFFGAVTNRAKVNKLIVFYQTFKIDRSHIDINHKPPFLRLKTAMEELFLIQEELNKPIPMIPFLIERASISRSMIYSFISQLKSGGYISTDNGNLIKIIKKIPERY